MCTIVNIGPVTNNDVNIQRKVEVSMNNGSVNKKYILSQHPGGGSVTAIDVDNDKNVYDVDIFKSKVSDLSVDDKICIGTSVK